MKLLCDLLYGSAFASAVRPRAGWRACCFGSYVGDFLCLHCDPSPDLGDGWLNLLCKGYHGSAVVYERMSCHYTTLSLFPLFSPIVATTDAGGQDPLAAPRPYAFSLSLIGRRLNRFQPTGSAPGLRSAPACLPASFSLCQSCTSTSHPIFSCHPIHPLCLSYFIRCYFTSTATRVRQLPSIFSPRQRCTLSCRNVRCPAAPALLPSAANCSTAHLGTSDVCG